MSNLPNSSNYDSQDNQYSQSAPLATSATGATEAIDATGASGADASGADASDVGASGADAGDVGAKESTPRTFIETDNPDERQIDVEFDASTENFFETILKHVLDFELKGYVSKDIRKMKNHNGKEINKNEYENFSMDELKFTTPENADHNYLADIIDLSLDYDGNTEKSFKDMQTLSTFTNAFTNTTNDIVNYKGTPIVNDYTQLSKLKVSIDGDVISSQYSDAFKNFNESIVGLLNGIANNAGDNFYAKNKQAVTRKFELRNNTRNLKRTLKCKIKGYKPPVVKEVIMVTKPPNIDPVKMDKFNKSYQEWKNEFKHKNNETPEEMEERMINDIKNRYNGVLDYLRINIPEKYPNLTEKQKEEINKEVNEINNILQQIDNKTFDLKEYNDTKNDIDESVIEEMDNDDNDIDNSSENTFAEEIKKLSDNIPLERAVKILRKIARKNPNINKNYGQFQKKQYQELIDAANLPENKNEFEKIQKERQNKNDGSYNEQDTLIDWYERKKDFQRNMSNLKYICNNYPNYFNTFDGNLDSVGLKEKQEEFKLNYKDYIVDKIPDNKQVLLKLNDEGYIIDETFEEHDSRVTRKTLIDNKIRTQEAIDYGI